MNSAYGTDLALAILVQEPEPDATVVVANLEEPSARMGYWPFNACSAFASFATVRSARADSSCRPVAAGSIVPSSCTAASFSCTLKRALKVVCRCAR